jgi:hypothetical protein
MNNFEISEVEPKPIDSEDVADLISGKCVVAYLSDLIGLTGSWATLPVPKEHIGLII